MAGKTAILTLRILGDAKDAQKALGDAESKAGGFAKNVEKGALPAAAALGALGAVAYESAQNAVEDAKAQDLLAQALRGAGGASKEQIKQTEDFITQTSRAAAVTDDELRPALSTLVRATGDVQQSQKLLTSALDISAATGKPVQKVADALAKAYGGQTSALSRLVPGLDKNVVKSKDMTKIMAELSKITGGAAATAANSTAGKFKSMTIQFDEAKEALGGALLPALTKLADLLMRVAIWVQNNTRLVTIIVGVIATFAAGILALNAALRVYNTIQAIMKINNERAAASQWALNAAMLANPITWIIVGIVALIAVIVLIATKTTWFQDIWTTVWGAITGVAKAAWTAITNAASVAIAWLVNVWQSVRDAASKVWDWIVNAAKLAWQTIIAAVKIYIGIYVAIFEGIKAAVGAVWTWLVNIARSTWQTVINLVRTYVNTYISIFRTIIGAVGDVWGWLERTARAALSAILHPIESIKAAFDRVVDAIQNVISWLGRIKIPDVLSKAGSILGGILGRSAPSSAGAPMPVYAGRRVGGLSAPAPRTSRSTINVYVPETSDPIATARAIKRIMQRGAAAGINFGVT